MAISSGISPGRVVGEANSRKDLLRRCSYDICRKAEVGETDSAVDGSSSFIPARCSHSDVQKRCWTKDESIVQHAVDDPVQVDPEHVVGDRSEWSGVAGIACVARESTEQVVPFRELMVDANGPLVTIDETPSGSRRSC